MLGHEPPTLPPKDKDKKRKLPVQGMGFCMFCALLPPRKNGPLPFLAGWRKKKPEDFRDAREAQKCIC